MNIIITAVVAVVAVLAVISIYIRNYIKVPPNQVAVFTGRGTPKIVRGGARFKMPGLERVDRMSLEPFDVNISLANALTSDGVPVNIEAVGLAKIGSSEEAVNTAIQRFLTADRTNLSGQINEIFAGGLRGIVATMTVEELNSSRDKLATGVIDEVGSDLEKIGLEVDTLKIQTISDNNGYLLALGQKRTAEVKRDAEIGTAEAERDAKIKSAAARQAGAVAEAEADTAIATANKERDVELARLRAATEAQNATADQAGPLAQAEAQKAVGVAEEKAEAARVEARTEVETKRAQEATARLNADVIAPAEAQKAAAIAVAEGQRQAAILRAQADAEAARQTGLGNADARKSEADAVRAEKSADADGRLAMLQAEATGKKADAEAVRAAKLAEADGLLAMLKAEAEGKAKVAAALNAYSASAAHLLTLPDVLAAFVSAADASAKQVGAIDNISIIGGGDAAKSGVQGLLGITPQNIAGVVESLKVTGIDLPGILNALSGNDDSSTSGTWASTPASTESMPSTPVATSATPAAGSASDSDEGWTA